VTWQKIPASALQRAIRFAKTVVDDEAELAKIMVVIGLS
jgi:hypothetical protein